MVLRVAPYVGAWIETKVLSLYVANLKSHPTWVRGLKLLKLILQKVMLRSHPTWVRGLKQSALHLLNMLSPVAPYVGAWIETFFNGTYNE